MLQCVCHDTFLVRRYFCRHCGNFYEILVDARPYCGLHGQEEWDSTTVEVATCYRCELWESLEEELQEEF